MKNKKTIILLASLLFLSVFFIETQGYAKDVAFRASLNTTAVSPGRQARLYLIFLDEVNFPPPDVPFVEGLNIRYLKTSTEPVKVGEVAKNTTIYMYSVVPRNEGEFTIGPISFTYLGDNYTSNTVKLEVGRDAAEQSREETTSSSEEDLSGRIYLEVNIPEREVYVNQKVPVTAKVYSDWIDLEQVQVWDTPSSEFITQKYETGKTVILNKDGKNFVVVEFFKWFFVPSPGAVVFGPVMAKFNVAKKSGDPINKNEAFYNSFIGSRGKRAMELESDTIAIRALPLPVDGRPQDFRGAVGDFILDAGIDKNEVNLGDIVTLTIKVSGDGNFGTVNIPAMEKTDSISFYEPQVTKEENSVTFKQLLKIKSDGIDAVPQVEFSFFSPTKKEYVSLKKGPFPLKVIAPEGKKESITQETPLDRGKAPEAKAQTKIEEELGAGLIYLKDHPGKLTRSNPYFYTSKGFILLQLMPLLFLGISVLVSKRMHLMSTDTAYASWIRASRKANSDIQTAKSLLRHGKSEEFYSHIFKMMQTYLGTRTGTPPGGLTEELAIKMLKEKTDVEELFETLRSIFSDCYQARYAPLEFDKEDMKETLNKVEEAIKYLNTKRKL